MNEGIRQFWADDRGAELVEWAVVTVILLVATVPVLLMIRDSLNEIFKSMFEKLGEDPDDLWVQPGGAVPVPSPTP
jgi:Flp pilus assembly pilin Flp